ncbi:hypothetical protein [Chryseobacterium flavum]|uniref:hypothetical protein n=1 Tax=Chryseobacterium flavum TaxID=415851 RepID=UPI0028AB43EC|nr:hypothetical protein [Chryseobacterium flavum]
MKISEKTPVKKELPLTQPEKPFGREQVMVTAVQKTSKPLSKQGVSLGFSINSFLNKEETTVAEETVVIKNDNLPQNHFTDTDLQVEWNLMLKQLQRKDGFVFNAVKTFKLIKAEENKIKVLYPSDSAKAEFDKISGVFFNHFKRKVHNHIIEIEYQRDVENLKIEVMTKRKIFEKFIEKNPLLKDLDDLMKFDLT